MDYNHLAEQLINNAKPPKRTQVFNRFSVYSHGEHQVIFYLFKNSGKPIVPSDISKYTDTSTARIATILNNLEDKGMVTREISREDRRKILVSITDKGRKYAETAHNEFMGHIATVLQAMGEERAKSFVESIKIFLDLTLSLESEKQAQETNSEMEKKEE
ncbi:MarR family winged helix-turn-helix transcriptional regulator [Lactococcus sp.]|uniref:MarR family winged helix-turn-helix transcriptional regulator n=1 Tax=Lactococcus sp. TaxID=44273 RepID=UPI0035B280CD